MVIYQTMRLACFFFFAGHESISPTPGWILLEPARHPEIQTRLRAEIRETEAAIRARGGTQFTGTDFEAMSYAMAVIKVHNVPSSLLVV